MKKLSVFAVACVLGSSLYAADGATIYKKCAACHGQKAEKSFLNKVPVLTTLSKDDMVASMKAYKAGTLNKFNSAAMMKPIVGPMSEADMAAVAEYITTLK